MKKILFLILFIVNSFGLFSQFQVKNFFSLTGKKDVMINSIVQDENGFLWLATNDGVLKFDGKSAVYPFLFKEIKTEVTSVYIDRNQIIWVGTKEGKVFFIKKNKLDSISFKEHINTERITCFGEMDSTICIGTNGNGLYAIINNNLKHYDIKNGLSDNVIYSITCGKKKQLWCATDAGITVIDDINRIPKFTYISNKNGLPDNIIRGISLEDDRLLISMQDSGSCYFNLKTNKIERELFFKNWTLGAVLFAKSKSTRNMIIATEKSGIISIDNGNVSTYNYEDCFQTSSINYVFIDYTNQIWIATKKGLSQLYPRRFDFVNSINGLVDEKILAVTVDNNQSIWVGTNHGISQLMTNSKGQYVAMMIDDFSETTISCATKAPDGSIWFGTYGNGVIVMDIHKKKKSVFNSKNKPLLNDNISNIYFDKGGIVYISTLGGGLAKASYNNDKNEFDINYVYSESNGLGSSYVYAAITDINGKLFVATDGSGLQVLNNNQFISLTDKYAINSKTIYSLCKDRFNTIWATSNSDGILKYDGKTIKTFKASNGLRDEQPQQLISSGNILYALNTKGIDKINCKDNSISYYDILDGGLEPNLNAIYSDQNKMYCGTNKGVLIYRTIPEYIDTIRPTAFIKDLQINYKPFGLDSCREFFHSQNNISFAYGGVWLKFPEKLSFRIQLIGYDVEWIYSDEAKIVTYNNLGSGSYTFAVQSKNEEEIWSTPKYFEFSILTPIWQKWWFWVLIISILILGIYIFVKYRLKAFKKQNILLEQRVIERTNEIEKQSQIIESKNRMLEQLSLVASETDNVVLILDAEGRLEYVNESFVKLNGMTLEELKKNVGPTIFDISNNPNIKTIVAEAVYYKKSVNYEALNKFEDGNEVWESSTLTPIFGEDGVLKKIIIIDTDITERKKQEGLIIQKNKDITDSISYARKIQHAILPQDELIKTYLPNSFVLYMTKDIVSGDFYWFTHIENETIIAAVDCTGHGVPGAFMSLIGYNLLNRIVNEQKITNPKDILYELNQGVLDALYKNESESKDGMDVAICKINHKTSILEFAGAMRPLWIVNNNQLVEIKADKIPIGTRLQDRENGVIYHTYSHNIQKEDVFYIFTDGYSDQFGGLKNKKFSTLKFKELLTKISSKDFSQQEKICKEEHQDWKSSFEQVDDILVIGFSFSK